MSFVRLGRGTLLAGGCAAVLLLGGCASGGDSEGAPVSPPAPTASEPGPASSAPEPTTSPSSPSPTQSTPAPERTPAQTQALLVAADTAVGAVGGSRLYAIDREGTSWEVDVVTSDGTRYELHVSTNGKKVVSGPQRKGKKAKYLDRIKAAKVDQRTAVDAILSAVPAAVVSELELDTEHGRTVWEADVRNASGDRRSLEIDARTGIIVKNRPKH